MKVVLNKLNLEKAQSSYDLTLLLAVFNNYKI